MSCKKYDHVTPILINLHWLPVRYRINFKILLLTFKALYGMAPSYIIDLINVKTNTRYSLRSSEGILLKHPSGRMKKSFGDRSFSVAAPTLWNALPASLRNIKCISTFTTVPEPLSALLMMSVRRLSCLQSLRSRVVRLSCTVSGVILKMSCSTASKKVSKAGSL